MAAPVVPRLARPALVRVATSSARAGCRRAVAAPVVPRLARPALVRVATSIARAGCPRAVAAPVVPRPARPALVRVATSSAPVGCRSVRAVPAAVRPDPVATGAGWHAPTTPGSVPGLVRRRHPAPEGRWATARCRPARR
ncbi:hypothetical protein [Micromonospora tulbaghiae]|uniref:hypothetical protein n=1 Tax=Micromonospora tulbaghiae TaxID=479978 RepID=UPI003423A326